MTRRFSSCVSVLVFLLLSVVLAFSEPVDLSTAQTMADSFLEREMAMDRRYRTRVGVPDEVDIVAKHVLACPDTQATLGFVFDLEPTGYIVAPADTRIVPVIAHSYTSPFSWDEGKQNTLLHLLRADLANRLQAVKRQVAEQSVLERSHDRWQYYLETERHAVDLDASPTVYGPWLTYSFTWPYDTWRQGSPYNDHCPWYSDEACRTIVGCVATALAQILNYWQHPTAVTFTAGDSYHTGTHEIWVDAPSANFSGLDYNSCNPSDTAKAQLSFAAGVSVRMNYGCSSSGAVTAQVAPALAGSWYPWSGAVPERWGYVSADLRTHNPTYDWWPSPYYTTEASFYDQLSDNMTRAHPVQMSVTEPGGHAIVVDGWKGGREYHLNYGWGGYSDGWYSLPEGMYRYTVIRYAILNILPTTTTRTLTVNTEGTGSGTVDVLPNQASFTHGSHVILEAQPGPGSEFTGWSGAASGTQNPIRVIMDGSKTVTATFDAATVPDCLFWEDFTGVPVDFYPPDWQRTHENWGVHDTDHAGGTPPEMRFRWNPNVNDIFVLMTPLIDGTPHTGLQVSFKHMVDDFSGGGYQLAVATTPDGAHFTGRWVLEPTANVPAETVTVDLSAVDGEEFYLAFAFLGDSWDINYWYIDDICVHADTVPLPDEFQVRRETGDVLTPGAFYGKEFRPGGADLAEWVAVSEPVEPGHVLKIDPTGIGQYRLAQGPCTVSVAGVVSTQPGMVLGGEIALSSEFEVLGEGKAMLALLGVVPVKVTDEGGPIAVGDLLVVSSSPGYAMRWNPESGQTCGLVGKALEPHEAGEGMIEVLDMRPLGGPS